MATRYWVNQNASNNWDATAPTNFGSASGVADNQAVPVAGDLVIFDANSGNCTINVNTAALGGLDMTNYVGTMTHNASVGIFCRGPSPLIFGAGMTYTKVNSLTSSLTLNGLNNTTLTTNGHVMGNINLTGAGSGTITLGSALVCGNIVTPVSNGINDGGFSLSAFSLQAGSAARTYTFSAPWNITGNAQTVYANGAGGLTIAGGVNAGLNFTYSGSTGTRSINLPAVASGTYNDINIVAGSDTVASAIGWTTNKNVNFTGFSGICSNLGACVLTGDLTYSPTMTFGLIITTSFQFNQTSGMQKITSNGVISGATIIKTGVGGTLQLQDNFSSKNLSSFITVNSGTFDCNNKEMTFGAFSSSGTGVRSVINTPQTWTLLGLGTTGTACWNTADPTNLTITLPTTIKIISAAGQPNKIFSGGGLTFNNLEYVGAGTVQLQLVGNNTFNDFKVSAGSLVGFTAGSNNSARYWTWNGLSGSLPVFSALTAAGYTLTKIGPEKVHVNFISISRCTGLPIGSWYVGPDSTDGGNNVNLSFTTPNLGDFMFAQR